MRKRLAAALALAMAVFPIACKKGSDPGSPDIPTPAVPSSTHTPCAFCTATFTPTETHTGTSTPTPSPSLTPTPTPDFFTIVVFPDTQGMVQSYPAIWEGMALWVVDHKADNNIVAVLGEGDIVNVPNDTDYSLGAQGWDRIKNAGVVYVPSIGNHDYDMIIPALRGVDMYNEYFGAAYFSGQPWYGSNYQSSNDNYYVSFPAQGNDYLVFSLELFPRDEVLAWAQGIVNSNHDKKIIVVTHNYLNPNGVRTLSGDPGGTKANFMDSQSNDSQMVWDEFIKVNPEIFLVIGGHMTGNPKCNYSTDINDDGGVVHQLFVNYQDVGNGGDGYMALLRFEPSLNKITTVVYSEYLKAYAPGVAFVMNEEF